MFPGHGRAGTRVQRVQRRRGGFSGDRTEVRPRAGRLLVIVASVLIGLAAAPMEAASPIVIKFSHVVAKEAPKGRAADRFADLVNQRLKGRVEVQVFHNSSLFKDREEIEALQLGAVQLLAPSTAKLVPWFPQYQVFDLPYLFSDQEHAYKSMTHPRVTARRTPSRTFTPRGCTRPSIA